MIKRNLLLIVLAALAIQGCATVPKNVEASGGQDDAKQMRAVHSDLVEQMIRQGNYHAALAHIEELKRDKPDADKLTLLRAKVLYKLGRLQEAQDTYVALMGGPFDADAMHGIGLIHAINNPRLSLDYLGKASRGRPTDAGMRNDYGYALLRQGDFAKARLQLVTAHELAPQDIRYRNNALLAMLVLNDENAAESLAKKSGVSGATLDKIRAEARQWQTRGAAANRGKDSEAETQSHDGATKVAAAEAK